MSDLPLLPDQPSTTDQVRRLGPPAIITLAARRRRARSAATDDD